MDTQTQTKSPATGEAKITQPAEPTGATQNSQKSGTPPPAAPKTQTHPPGKKKLTGRPTLDDRIAQAEARLAEREKEREAVAATLRSLKAAKANKDRKAKAAERTRVLIQMGLQFEQILNGGKPEFTEQFLNYTQEEIKEQEAAQKKRKKEFEAAEKKKEKTKEEIEICKMYKAKAKIIKDKKLVLERLTQIRDQLAQEQAAPRTEAAPDTQAD